MTTMPPVAAMSNPIRDYDWGSVTALAGLQGRAPDGGPEAELWMGAHPAAPSSVRVGRQDVPLPQLIASAPEEVLGPDVRAAFGDRLPYVLKILAIAHPLSVQVHPSAARARAMFGRPGSPYVDAAHKPELLYALEPTEALFGFRPAAEVVALLSRLGSGRLGPLLADLGKDGSQDADRLHAALRTLITWPDGDRAALVAEVAAGAAMPHATGAAYGWVGRLARDYPADPMVLAPLLLDLLLLQPGEVVFVPAGVPHCYLDGFGVEIMAASDNVLRCGLTSKPIAVDELLEVVDCRPRSSPAAVAVRLGESELAWRVPVADFQISRLDVAGSAKADPSLAGPQVVLCTAGSVTVSAPGASVTLTPGRSALVAAQAGQLTLSGAGVAFRAAPGNSSPGSAGTGSAGTGTGTEGAQ